MRISQAFKSLSSNSPFPIFSRLTGDPKYENAVEGISQKVHSLILDDPASPNNGLVPIFINANTGKFRYNQGHTYQCFQKVAKFCFKLFWNRFFGKLNTDWIVRSNPEGRIVRKLEGRIFYHKAEMIKNGKAKFYHKAEYLIKRCGGHSFVEAWISDVMEWEFWSKYIFEINLMLP